MDHEILSRRIREIGFSCTRCGACCSSTEDDANLVMVSPREITFLARESGQVPGDFTEPYPECIETDEGGSITFDWCLRRTEVRCIFEEENHCRVYPARPWICRTYPFVLDGDDLNVSLCEGIGGQISEKDAWTLAGQLLERQKNEHEEEYRIRHILSRSPIPP